MLFAALLVIFEPCAAIRTIANDAGGAVAWRPVPSFEINLDLAPEQRYVGVATRFNSSIWRFYDKLFAHDAALTNALYAMVDARGPEPDSVMRVRSKASSRRRACPRNSCRACSLCTNCRRSWCPSSTARRARTRCRADTARWDAGPCVARAAPGYCCDECRGRHGRPREEHGPGSREVVRAARLRRSFFTRNGSVVFRAEMVAGYVSLLTGYRPGAYVVERNTRYPAHRGATARCWIICSTACRCRAGRCGA